jgi:hypothetical protein
VARSLDAVLSEERKVEMRAKAIPGRIALATLAVVIAIPSLVPPPADAAVAICKRGKKLRLREDACKPREIRVEATELGAVGPPGAKGDPGSPGAAAVALWARVRSDGTLASGSGVVSTSVIAPGQFHVIFDRSVDGCAWIATLGNLGPAFTTPIGQIGVAGTVGNVNGILVRTYNSAGADQGGHNFHVAVYC